MDKGNHIKQFVSLLEGCGHVHLFILQLWREQSVIFITDSPVQLPTIYLSIYQGLHWHQGWNIKKKGALVCCRAVNHLNIIIENILYDNDIS